MKNEAELHKLIESRQARVIIEYLEQDEKHLNDFKTALYTCLFNGRMKFDTGINTCAFIFQLNHPSLNDVVMNIYCDNSNYSQLAIATRDDRVKIDSVQFSLPINQMRYACLIGDLASVQNLIKDYNNNNDIIKPDELVDISCFEFVFVSRPFVEVSRCKEILKILLEFSCFDRDIEITNQIFEFNRSKRLYFLNSIKFLIGLHHLKRNLYHGKVRDFLKEHFDDGSRNGDLWKLKILIRDLHEYLTDQNLLNHSLETACMNGYLSIVEYLMQHELREKLNYTISHNNNLCIIFAALSDRVCDVELIEYIDSLDDPNVDLMDDCPDIFRNQDGAFTNYAVRGLESVVNYIVKTPKYNERITDKMIDNAYIAACRGGHLNVALKILALRSDQLNLVNVHNQAFIEACINGHDQVVEHLLKEEKRFLDYSSNNNAALMGAIRNRHFEIVETLLKLNNPKIDYKYNNDEAFRFICSTSTYLNFGMINLFLNLRQPEVDYNANNGEPLCLVIRSLLMSLVTTFMNLPNINPSLNDFEALRVALQVGLHEAIDAIVTWAFRNGYQREVRNIIEQTNSLRTRNYQINYPQSIHAVSVHHSVSNSALKLKSSYGNQIDTDEKLSAVIQKLQVEVSKFEASEKGLTPLMVSAAKRYIASADNPDVFSRFRFKDLKSQLTTQEVIALSYLATQDSTRLLPGCDDKDAITSLVRCFYEAQRGYNIGEDEQDDNNAHDNTICTSGCFNKAIEALNGIHRDVEIVVVTLTQATLKLRKVVEHCTMAYIAQTEKEDRLKAKQLVELITADGVVAIWPIIKPNVLKAMHEFAEYLSHGDLSSFGLLIESGIDIGTTAILKQYWLKAIVREQVTVLIEHGKVGEQVLLSVSSNDIGELWDIIKPLIEDRVFEKTKEEFPKGKEHIEFTHFINKGRMVDLSDLVRKPSAVVTFSPSLKSNEVLDSAEKQILEDNPEVLDNQNDVIAIRPKI